MNQFNQDREVIRRYLLGGVAEAELPSLEERILMDDNFYQELLIAEDELIDQYLLDTLSESERTKFISHFMITPEREEKLRFSTTFKRYLTAGGESHTAQSSPELVSAGDKSNRKGWFGSYFPITGHQASPFGAIFGNRLVLAAISLLILIAVSVVLINRRSDQKSVGPQDFFIATLTPGLTRDSGETTRIKIPPEKKMVRLELQLELLPSSSQNGLPSNSQSGSSANNYQSYTAELRTSENSTVLHRDNLPSVVKGNRQVVNLDVPAEDLRGGNRRGGDYHVRLSGVAAGGGAEPIGRYSFRIVN